MTLKSAAAPEDSSVETEEVEKKPRTYEGEFVIYLRITASLERVPQYLRKNKNLQKSVERMKKMIYIRKGRFVAANKVVGFTVGRSSFSWHNQWINRVADIHGKTLWKSAYRDIEDGVEETEEE